MSYSPPKDLLNPKEITIENTPSGPVKFLIGKFSAFDGLRIITQYERTMNNPSADDHSVEDVIHLVKKVIQYSEILKTEGQKNISVKVTEETIEGHGFDYQLLLELTKIIMEYNTSFLGESPSKS